MKKKKQISNICEVIKRINISLSTAEQTNKKSTMLTKLPKTDKNGLTKKKVTSATVTKKATI